MRFLEKLKFVLGYVNVDIEGYYLERLINLSKINGISLDNIKRMNDIRMNCDISIKDFKRIKIIVKKTKSKLKIKKKIGIPIIANRYRKRKILIIFLFFIIGGIVWLSNYIWNIDIQITGEDINKSEIIKFLSEQGVYSGAVKRKIDTNKIIEKLRYQRNDIAWATSEIVGTNYKIEIVENTKKPDVINQDEYCNIVANEDGMVFKINALNGTKRVEEGQVVKKGDILIEGVMEGKYTGVRYVHSEGEVLAKKWYTATSKIYYKNEEINITGNKEEKYAIKLKNFKINLYKTISNFDFYDTISENNRISIIGDFYLPIEIIKNTNNEYIKTEKNYTKEEAIQKGLEASRKQIEEKLTNDEKIEREIVNTYENDQYVDVEVTYEIINSIGTKEKIVF